MSDPDEQPAYRVEPGSGGFAVIEAAGSVQIFCRDVRNAEQYAALMNAAYRRGYKAGFRKGRGRPD
jgi:hypothetical protein